MPPLRVFAALAPPARARDDLAARLSAASPPVAGLRWTPPKLWHLTLAFVPDLDAHDVAPLSDRLRAVAAETVPPTVQIRGGGAFPSVRRARVLWAGVRGTDRTDDEVLLDLGARAVRATRPGQTESGQTESGQIESGGTDDRPFRPHVTVARTARPSPVHAAVACLEHYQGPPWRVSELRLVRSELGAGPGGRPRYETLASFTLGTGS